MKSQTGILSWKSIIPIILFMVLLILLSGESVNANQNSAEDMGDLIITDLWSDESLSTICFQEQNVGTQTISPGHVVFVSADDVEQFQFTVEEELSPYERFSTCYDSAWICSDLRDTIFASADFNQAVDELDEYNNNLTEDWNCDQVAPIIITPPQAINITDTSATITWTTDEDSDSRVEFDTLVDAFGDKVYSEKLSTDHYVDLVGLTPGTLYQYKVTSADQTGNLIESAPLFFETNPQTDTENPKVSDPAIVLTDAQNIWYNLRQPATDNSEIDRVEFYIDGSLFATDYSSEDSDEGYFSADLVAGLLGINPEEFLYSGHTITSRALDTSGLESINDYVFTPGPTPFNGNLTIVNPAPETVYYIPGVQVPIGRGYIISAQAELFHDECTLVPSLNPFDPDPIKNKPIQCDKGSHAVHNVTFSVGPYGGALNQICDVHSTNDATRNYSCEWNIGSLSQGLYEIVVNAYDNAGRQLSETRIFEILQGEWNLTLDRSLASNGSFFNLTYNFHNEGTLPLQLTGISDSLDGFIPLSKSNSGTFLVSNDYDLFTDSSNLSITPNSAMGEIFTLLPGGSLSFELSLAPILYAPLDLSKYLISPRPITIGYREVGGVDRTKVFNLPTDITDEGRALGNAVMVARSVSDYQIITYPFRVYEASDGDREKLFNAMAELAILKNGILGFFPYKVGGYTNNETIALIRFWGSTMQGSDGVAGHYLNNGYLLIVGEETVIPSSSMYTSLTGSDWADARVVDFTDNPYADTNWDLTYPELIVGRILGRWANELRIPIQTSINVTRNLPSVQFDRSTALLIAGSGDGVDSFNRSIDQVDAMLQHYGIVTSKYKASSLGDTMLAFLLFDEDDKDYIIYRDHCNYNVWSDAFKSSDFRGSNPIDFGSTRPVVLASCCLAGRYSGPVDDDIATPFLKANAGVYIGATELSPREQNNQTALAFADYANYLPTIGMVLKYMKLEMDHDEEFDRLWALEYNLYGDPKYGNTSPLPPHSRSLPTEQVLSIAGGSRVSVDVIIPDLVLTPTESGYEASLEGGGMVNQTGYPSIPQYQSRFLLPANSIVTDVSLSLVSSTTQYPGVVLPIFEPLVAGVDFKPSRQVVPVFMETWPEMDYEWRIERMPSGEDALVITSFPLKYYPLQALVEFSKNFTYEISYATNNLTFTMIAPSEATVYPGEEVLINMWLNNPGMPINAVVGTSIYREDGLLAAGLPGRILSNAQGLITLSQTWSTFGVEPGTYHIKTTLWDMTGIVLDTFSSKVSIGSPEGNVGNLIITSDLFEPGDNIDISFDFANTGSTLISGTAYAVINGPGLIEPITLTETFSDLFPANYLVFHLIWDTYGMPAQDYTVNAYVMFNSTATESLEGRISAYKHVYLPFITR